jgi:hypothetical protein
MNWRLSSKRWLDNKLKTTDAEIFQIKRLANSTSIRGLSDAVIRSLDESSLSRIIAGYLYLKANRRPDKDFATYLATKELWSTLSIGLNVMGAILPAMIFDKEFRTLALKTGLNKGSEIGSKTFQKKMATASIDESQK